MMSNTNTESKYMLMVLIIIVVIIKPSRLTAAEIESEGPRSQRTELAAL